VDDELEKKNFQKAGELLADLWSERIIDKFPVIAEFVLPGKNRRTKLNSSLENDGDGRHRSRYGLNLILHEKLTTIFYFIFQIIQAQILV
jgi:hypothetical protein